MIIAATLPSTESVTSTSGVKRERDSFYYSVHPYAFISDYGGLLMRNYRASYGLLDYKGVLEPSKMSDGYNPTYSHTNSMQKETADLPKPAIWTGLLNYQRQYPYEVRRKRQSFYQHLLKPSRKFQLTQQSLGNPE